jgi:hypothetical protein
MRDPESDPKIRVQEVIQKYVIQEVIQKYVSRNSRDPGIIDPVLFKLALAN